MLEQRAQSNKIWSQSLRSVVWSRNGTYCHITFPKELVQFGVPLRYCDTYSFLPLYPTCCQNTQTCLKTERRNMKSSIEEIINTTVTGKPLPNARRKSAISQILDDPDVKFSEGCDACANRHARCFKPNPGIVCHWCFENGIDCTYERLKPKRGRKKYRKGLNVFKLSTRNDLQSSSSSEDIGVMSVVLTPPSETPGSPITSPLEIDLATVEVAAPFGSQHFEHVPSPVPSPQLTTPRSMSCYRTGAMDYTCNFPRYEIQTCADLITNPSACTFDAQFLEFPPYFATEPQDLDDQHISLPANTYAESNIRTLLCPVPQKPFSRELRSLVKKYGGLSGPRSSFPKVSTPYLLHRPHVGLPRRSHSSLLEENNTTQTFSDYFLAGFQPIASSEMEIFESDASLPDYAFLESDLTPDTFVHQFYEHSNLSF
ncbi:hypothetical protein VKT23_017990 [Stygiomarasmius scandens]|uniref:Zn(2)-C6 fungal-type domain-containing protein n=1 Tax=Marasmiellus scandens TaxID=2682957 RepID=A0ABR1ISA6_9AGAR